MYSTVPGGQGSSRGPPSPQDGSSWGLRSDPSPDPATQPSDSSPREREGTEGSFDDRSDRRDRVDMTNRFTDLYGDMTNGLSRTELEVQKFTRDQEWGPGRVTGVLPTYGQG